MESIEKKYFLLAVISGTIGGFVSAVAGSAHIWINMIVAALVSAGVAYLFKEIIVK